MRKDPKAYQKRMDKLYSHTMHDYITKENKGAIITHNEFR